VANARYSIQHPDSLVDSTSNPSQPPSSLTVERAR
jgi:hypothetical protein